MTNLSDSDIAAIESEISANVAPKVKLVDVLTMRTSLSLCGAVCGSFDKDAAIYVYSRGMFPSRGERAVANALAKDVRCVQVGSQLDATFVAFSDIRERDDGESRDPRGYRVCDQDLRVRVQVALPRVGIEPSEGATTSASGVAHEIMQRMHVGAGKGNGSSSAAM